jgi:hypothetical protein
MKLAGMLALAALGLAALGLTGGAALWFQPVQREPAAVAVTPGSGPRAEADTDEVELLAARIAMLEDRLGDVEAALELLRSAVERQPAGTARDPADLARLAAEERGEFTDAERQAMAAILARAREQEALRRAAERAAREEELVLDRARYVAAELGLPPADEACLAEHLREEDRRRGAILERWRAEQADRELLGAELLALHDWSEQHLAETFGAELAARIRETERARRGSVPGESQTSGAPGAD